MKFEGLRDSNDQSRPEGWIAVDGQIFEQKSARGDLIHEDFCFRVNFIFTRAR